MEIPISKWEDLTDDEEVIEALHEVYGEDVEKLDLQVGLQAEKKIKGFAISETAFFIFLLIASRRLEAYRFFTTNFNSKTYTEKGLEWVNKTETLKDVIDRHFPEMTRKWMTCSSAFSVWDSMPTPANYIPLYLRPFHLIFIYLVLPISMVICCPPFYYKQKRLVLAQINVLYETELCIIISQ
ncbi:hypothetical protein ACB092_04G096900 [Castanea dentata]